MPNDNKQQENNPDALFTEQQVMDILSKDAATMEEAKATSRVWMCAAVIGTGLVRFAPHPGVKALGLGLTLVSLAKASKALDGE